MINLYFIRHAQTEFTGKGYIALDIDSKLSESGIEECRKNVFKEGLFNNVYCSPTKRARGTAKLLYPYKKAKETKLIAQKIQGELTGHFKNEFDAEYLNKLRNYEIIPKGAEQLNSVLNRIDKFLDCVIKDNPNNSNVLAITHNGIMRIIIKHYGKQKEYLNSKHLEGFIIEMDSNTKITRLVKTIKSKN